MMNISEGFIRRPIATSLIMLAIALFGVLAYQALPVSDLPNVDYPTLNVMASLPGADPNTMASSVATPLERQFTMIAGLDSMTSTSSTGSANITLQFDMSRDIDGATVDVQTAIAECTPLLPPGMPSPPSFRKQNPADEPIMFLALTSPTLPLWEVDEYAERMMAQRISMVPGVAQVNVFGAQKYAVRVQVDPDKLSAKRIGLNEVDQALQNWNVNVPTGTVYGPNTSYNILANGILRNAEAFKPVIITWRNGAPVRLQDIANVKDSVEDERNNATLYTKADGGLKVINLAIMRQPGSNTIEVTDNVRRLLPVFQSRLPPSVHLQVRRDRSKNIREAFQDVQFTMVLTLSLVIMVIFLFLRNGSATAIPSMALPFSILGTFAIMYMLDFSLNNMSMMALLLCVGFVVDDAIVMLENIVRHMEMGEPPMLAALNGSREIGFTIVSMTVSLAAVFIPVLFMGGILGRLFREFAVTICTAILISGCVSVTLTPMLCSRFLRGYTGVKKRSGFIMRIPEAAFNGLHRGYEITLGWVLRHRPVMAVLALMILVSTVYLYQAVPKGFIPEVDNDSLNGQIEAAQGTSYYKISEYANRVSSIIMREPDVDAFFISVGGGFGGMSSNTARVDIQLTPRRQRDVTAAQVLERIRPKLLGFAGFRAFLTIPAAIRVGGRMSKSSYQFTVQGPDTEQLYREAGKLEQDIAKLPMVQDVTTDLQMRSPRVNLDIDRDKAATYGLNATQIENTLYDAFGPKWASTIYTDTNQFRVLLELDPKYQQHADSLSKIYFKTASGGLVPMNSVIRMREDAMPQSINHSGQLPSVTLSFNLKPGVSLGEAVDAIQDLAKGRLPATMGTSFTGTAAAFQSSLRNLNLLLFVAIMVVYIVLGVLYESYIHPLTIVSGLPSAGFGALLTLMLFRVDLNIYSFVGLIMLVGLVMKNAIMQIDFGLEAERRGKSPAEAIYEGCLIRFRPIMMTTMAAMLGSIPIALGWGAGGESRRPLGLAVMGGLFFSQLITLYLTPVVYTYNARLLERFGKRKASRVLAAHPQPALGD